MLGGGGVHASMTTAIEELRQGIEILRPIMEPKGFKVEPCQTGRGSGGDFAKGAFVRGSRELSFSVRHSLGLVEYRVGQSKISHEEFLRYSGAWEKRAYPGFGRSVADSFLALRTDLIDHLSAFLDGADDDFLAVVRELEAHPNKFKGLRSTRWFP
jgi:hypothetical protein